MAQADLHLAETLISETSIYAPIAGVVLSKNMERGEIALPGSSILTLGDLSKVWLRAYINERDLGRVKIGQSVEENINFYSGIYKIPPVKAKERKQWILEMAGLEERRRSLIMVIAIPLLTFS